MLYIMSERGVDKMLSVFESPSMMTVEEQDSPG